MTIRQGTRVELADGSRTGVKDRFCGTTHLLTAAHARAASIGEPNPSNDSDYLAGCVDAPKRAGW